MKTKNFNLFLSTAILSFLVYGYQACSPVKFSPESSVVDDSGFISEPSLPFAQPPVESPPTPPVQKLCSTSELKQPDGLITNKLDLLFAIDTSGSLDDERPLIIQQINAFILALPSAIQVNVAVVLGHGNSQDAVFKSDFVGKLYSVNAAEPEVLILDAAKSNLAAVTTTLINKMNNAGAPQSGDSDGGEEVLYNLSQLLKVDNIALAKSQGFFRDDAGLAIIFIGDEADICARDANGAALSLTSNNGALDDEETNAFNRDCAGVTPETIVTSLVQEKTKTDINGQQIKYPLVVSAITYINANDGEIGNGYLETVALNKGIVADLNNPNFSVGLVQIGQLATVRLSLFDQYKLVAPAFTVDPNSITVKIGDPLLSANRVPANQFTFDAANLVFNFAEGERGKAGDIIEMNYCELTTSP